MLTAPLRSSRNPAYDSTESRRSPRDRSPGRYNDSRDEYRDRGGPARGSERRRSSIPDARANHNNFASNREVFREPVGRDAPRDFPPRDPPRGPKGLIDAPTGPRSNNYASDFRSDFGYRGDFRGGRGRGGRGRGWRDDSRDRNREADRDYRDRRDDRGPPREPFREERGRDRDRWDREPFRGRRPSSPQGRGRSPNYGPRDARDAPLTTDLDFARRGSRDGPLPGGSPSAESLQPFVRGYGRGRGSRGRGRGAFQDDYHRPPGRSRSPDPLRNRRAQPSATPPPVVPAFGSAANNHSAVPGAPLAPAAQVSGVPIPTAPRSHITAGRRHAPSSITLVVDHSKQAAPTAPSSLQSKGSVVASHSPDTVFSERSNSRPGSSQANQGIIEKASLSAASSSNTVPPVQSAAPRPIEHRKRRPIIGKRAPQAPRIPFHDATDDGSDSDSGEFGDDYFENEIRQTEEQISRVSAENLLIPRRPPPAAFLKPFLESAIDDILAEHQPDKAEECVAPVVKAAPPTTLSTGLAPKPKNKGKSRPTTPLPEADAPAKPKIPSKDRPRGAGPQVTSESSLHAQGRHAPSIILPLAPTDKSRDLPDQVLGGVETSHKGTNGNKLSILEQLEDSEGEQTEAEKLETLEAVRRQMRTPPTSTLPDFNTVPWHQDKDFESILATRNQTIEGKIRKSMREKREQILQEQDEERRLYKERYLAYRRWTDFSDEPVAVRSRDNFAKSRAQTAADAAAPLPSAVQAAGAKPEGQRRTGSRFATEHDIERVLRESEQEAKDSKDREERAARAMTASAKEATIPDMSWNAEEWDKTKFVDRTHIVPFERSFALLEFGEPIDNFTEEEVEIFERVYVETPKQWTKIAEALPRRDYKACIQHYYKTKHSSNIKEKVKKHGKKRKGRNAAKGPKPKSNALMADLRDDGEDGQETENGGERRRPRRAAAPTWPIETPQSESEVASPAPTPGRKTVATPKGDGSGEQPAPKRRTKTPREKGAAKQNKNSQLLAAAPLPATIRQDEPPAVQPAATEWKPNPRPSAPPSRYPPQYDGSGPNQPAFAPPYIPAERPMASMPVNFEPPPQSFPPTERLEPIPTPSVNFETPQDRRNTPQTSSYWSVPESTEFPVLLRHFGTDWHAIAKFMTSKTHIMVFKTIFQQWLTIPFATSKKKSFITNIVTQVKNYYQRQVESGKKEWEDCAKEADEKRARGEPLPPLPPPTIVTKRRYDVSGSMPRAGSSIDGIDDMQSTTGLLAQRASPQPPSMSSRFPALAQAGPVPHQPVNSSSTLGKHLSPLPTQQSTPQMQPQPRPSRGPALGYFNTERPIIQSDNVSQRSLQVAQEAQQERSTALRLEREQREQQQKQQQAMQRERQLQLKQENETPNLNQFEPFSAPSAYHGQLASQSRAEAPISQAPPSDIRRTATAQPQYQPRSHQPVRNFLGDGPLGNRDVKASPSPAIPRAPMSAPPTSREPYSAPPQSVQAAQPVQPPAPAPRQPEPVAKKSNLMALLNNDEPSDPRPAPTKRMSDVSTSSLQQPSQTPPPQHSLQPSRYATHSSQPSSQPPQHMLQSMAPHSSAQQMSQGSHSYSQQPTHSMHHHSSSLGHARSYTPTSGFDNRGYAPPPIQQQQQQAQQQQQQQQMFSQPSRQSIGSQPPSIRREPSLGDVHGVGSTYNRASAPSQPRLKESPYSATPPSTAQLGRSQAGSPLELNNDRDFYSRPQQYLMQQPSSATASPQLGTSYHSSQQQQQPPSHRQLAFGQSQSHTASPPTAFASQRPVQRSRQNSFDGGRYQMPSSTAPTSTQHGYSQPPPHQSAHVPMQYQQSQPSRDRIDYERERRMQEDFERERRLQEEAYRRRLDDQRR